MFLLAGLRWWFLSWKVIYLQLAVRSLASGEQLVSLLKRLVQVVDMREPVSKHHVYHKALMYDIGVGDCWIVSLCDIDLLIIHKVFSKLSFVRVGTQSMI